MLARLRTDGLLPVDAIAITHFHLDHWGDLVPWVWLTSRGLASSGKPALWLPPRGRGELGTFGTLWGLENMFETALEIAEYEPGLPFAAADFEVEARTVNHYGLGAYGFRVRDAAERVLAYSGDTGPCDELARLASDADLFLCEATLDSGAEDTTPRGHLSADEAVSIGAVRTLLTHRPTELWTPSGATRAVDGLTVQV